MSTMVKVKPSSGPVKKMDIEELDALYTKPLDDKVQSKIDELCNAIKLRVKTEIEYRMVQRRLAQRLLTIWGDDEEAPTFDGTWDAWYRNRHKATRVKAE